MPSELNNGLRAGHVTPLDTRGTSGVPDIIAALPDLFTSLGNAATAGATAYYNARGGLATARAAAAHTGSGYDYGTPLLGSESGVLPPAMLAQEEYAADALVNSAARQAGRIGSTLLDKYGGALLLAGIALFAWKAK